MDRVEPSPTLRTGANLTGNASSPPPPFAMSDVVSACGAMPGGYRAWLSVEIVALVAGLPANVALFWLLLLSKSKWSFSQVLLVNLAALGALYCLCFPLDAYLALHPGSDRAAGAVRAFYGLNLFGCPLFLIVICLERCVALAPPGRHRALGHGRHRLLCAASLWALAASMSAFSYHKPLPTTILSLVCFLPAVFALMLLCGVSLALAARRAPPEPAGELRGAAGRVGGVLAAALAAYAPVLCLAPLLDACGARAVGSVCCSVVPVLLSFPNLGVGIGPVFYLAERAGGPGSLFCLKVGTQPQEQESAAHDAD